MEKLAENLWIFDGPKVRFLGLSIPTRMTIARLNSVLWVHSPVPLTDQIIEFIQENGEVKYVVAPNSLHHLYLDGWQSRFQDAVFVAAPGLREKRGDLRFDEDLEKNASYPWTSAIAHDHFVGNSVFEEVVFYHHESRTLILTDLILNLKIDDFNWAQRLFARFDGIVYPDGKSPRLFQWSTRERGDARRCYQSMMDWAPDMIVISHGECILKDGSVELEKRLGWVMS